MHRGVAAVSALQMSGLPRIAGKRIASVVASGGRVSRAARGLRARHDSCVRSGSATKAPRRERWTITWAVGAKSLVGVAALRATDASARCPPFLNAPARAR